MELKTSQKAIINAKTKEAVVIRWIELDTYDLFTYPYRQIKKFTIASLFDRNGFHCNICNKKKNLVFSFITKKRLEYFKFRKWFKFCYDCSFAYYLLLKAKGMNDECLELIKFFINTEKNFYDKKLKGGDYDIGNNSL